MTTKTTEKTPFQWLFIWKLQFVNAMQFIMIIIIMLTIWIGQMVKKEKKNIQPALFFVVKIYDLPSIICGSMWYYIVTIFRMIMIWKWMFQTDHVFLGSITTNFCTRIQLLLLLLLLLFSWFCCRRWWWWWMANNVQI